MFVFINLFDWIFDLFKFEDKTKDFDMSLLRSISMNFSKLSYVISHTSGSGKSNIQVGLMSQIWSVLSKDRQETNILFQCLHKLNHFEIFSAGKKLTFERNALLDQDFQFKTISMDNLKFLLITTENSSLKETNSYDNSIQIKLEEYLDIVATKDDTYILAGYKEEQQFLNFCVELLQWDFCNIFKNKFISTVTNFDMEESDGLSGNEVDKGIQEKVTRLSFGVSTTLFRDTDANAFEEVGKDQFDVNVQVASAAKSEKTQTSSGKPPNVLVYTGSDCDEDEKFKSIQSILLQCLSRDKYVVYHLRRNQVSKTPWIDNAALLVLADEGVSRKDFHEDFLVYFRQGGIVVSLSSNFDENFISLSRPRDDRSSEIITISHETFTDVSVFGLSNCYEVESCTERGISIESVATNVESGAPVVLLVKDRRSCGLALLSLVSFERDSSGRITTTDQFVSLKLSNPSRIGVFRSILSTLGVDCNQTAVPLLSPLVLYGSSKASIGLFMAKVKDKLKGDLYRGKSICYSFLSKGSLERSIGIKPSEEFLPVVTDGIDDVTSDRFSFKTYKENLNSSVLGNVVLFGDVVTTTMDIINDFMNGMPPGVGLIAVTSTQTKGVGRGGNVWLSPKGCALFSLHVRLMLESPLGNHISCFQHLVALACILAVKTKKGYEKLNLKIKWPNDVYCGDKLKIGGVLVKSSILGSTVHINLGCGINVSNENPTTCLNDIIRQHNNNNNLSDSTECLAPFSVEEYIGRLITQIERLINKFQEDSGDSFYELYHQHWMHSNQEVNLYEADGTKGKIMGITREGYLLVRLEDGRCTEVHPDGNSFDMMRNLIVPKFQSDPTR